ncbi:MAG: hypothetical protein E4H32_10500, partial [Nitrospirales bacterium]
MTIRRPRVFLLVCWLISSGIGGLALPTVSAQSTPDSIQESVVKKPEGGILLKTVSGQALIPAPLLKTTVSMT